MTTKFQKGISGNPKGKPLGAKDSRTELRQLLQPHAAKLIKKAVDMALDGDPAALRLCVDRIIPSLKSTSEPLSISLPMNGNLDEQATAVFKLAASGDLSTDSAAQLIAMLGNQCRIKEMTEMEARLQALETQAVETSNGKFRK
jgi:hypothetical protein